MEIATYMKCGDSYIYEMCRGLKMYGSQVDLFSIVDICARFNVDIAKFKESYIFYELGLCESIYQAILNRLLYGMTFDKAQITNHLPNVALYNYYILGEHKGAIDYIGNSKAKVIELLKRHKEIMNNNLMEADMNITYHTIGTNDMKLIGEQPC